MRRTALLFKAVISALIFCSARAGAGAAAEQYKDYNLLMISITNIGTEHMSLYGYKRKTTPNLDKWAGGALVFEDAFTPASWTLPVATSLFTSLYPYTHKIMARDRNMALSKSLKTLPEFLKAAGYKTAAFTGGLDYMKSAGHMRGFETAPDNPPFTRFPVTTAQAADWLSKNSGGKFFLFLHGYDPHPPFIPSKRFSGVFSSTEGKHVTVDPSFTYRGYRETNAGNITVFYHVPRLGSGPESWKAKKSAPRRTTVLTQDDIDYLRDLYDEKILDADLEVGKFLDSLGKELLDRTIVVIFSEHGEMFAKHGRFGRAGAKAGTLYDEVAHVPLMIRLPGAQARRVRGLVQLIDIMPTLMQILEIPVPDRLQGSSLLPLMNADKPVNEFVYAGANYNTYIPEPGYAYDVESVNEFIRSDRWKLLHEVTFSDPKGNPAAKRAAETFELYDLKNDPAEAVNSAAAHPDIVKELKQKLKRWADSSRKFMKARPLTRKLPEAVREKAKQHGYW